MTTDEQEALSNKYGTDLFMVMSLSSGNYAVFDAGRKLHSIINRKEPSVAWVILDAGTDAIISFIPHKPAPRAPFLPKLKEMDLDL